MATRTRTRTRAGARRGEARRRAWCDVVRWVMVRRKLLCLSAVLSYRRGTWTELQLELGRGAGAGFAGFEKPWDLGEGGARMYEHRCGEMGGVIAATVRPTREICGISVFCHEMLWGLGFSGGLVVGGGPAWRVCGKRRLTGFFKVWGLGNR